ncbi:TPA: hypothetical protein N0F65_001951 [Lagenidium giganteum]|uniref:Transposase n=1 Tax=Lagenidium giganteum TaxID=4803 RepID=A0AAV2YXQ1_9STRA|nr:TPA: hypothetical protein N0F65_001951 [Lagenidium giganteum]
MIMKYHSASCVFWSANLAFARKINLPLIGCHSHRLNLATNVFLDNHASISSKVVDVMNLDSLIPVLQNETRWSSTYTMLRRFLDIAGRLDESDPELARLLPSPSEKLRISSLVDDLGKFDSLSKSITLKHARQMLDSLQNAFPHVLARHLSSDSSFVPFPHFKNAVTKIQSGKKCRLIAEERAAVVSFRRDENSD